MSQKTLCSDKFSQETLLTLNLDKFSLEVSPEGRGLFFNHLTGEILSLNKTGAFIVDNLRYPITLGKLTRIFAINFELSFQAAETDLREFLDILREMTLVHAS